MCSDDRLLLLLLYWYGRCSSVHEPHAFLHPICWQNHVTSFFLPKSSMPLFFKDPRERLYHILFLFWRKKCFHSSWWYRWNKVLLTLSLYDSLGLVLAALALVLPKPACEFRPSACKNTQVRIYANPIQQKKSATQEWALFFNLFSRYSRRKEYSLVKRSICFLVKL